MIFKLLPSSRMLLRNCSLKVVVRFHNIIRWKRTNEKRALIFFKYKMARIIIDYRFQHNRILITVARSLPKPSKIRIYF